MQTSESLDYWRKCSTCKKPIQYLQKYWVCSVSTCNRQRTGLAFCTVSCFDAHVPMMNHRDSGAFERKAPSRENAVATQEAPARPSLSQTSSPPTEDEILVVVSKVKDYIRKRTNAFTAGGMNTSDRVMDVLSRHVRRMADVGIEQAKQSGRTTVMDRDIR